MSSLTESISEQRKSPAQTSEVIEAAKKINMEGPDGTAGASDILKRENKYKVESLLAKGGMAMVFKAKDKNCRRTVALKLINDKDIENKEVVHRFIEEAQIAAQLDHPNIMPIYELNIDRDGNPFYAMKLVNGSTLEEILIGLKQNDKQTVREYPLSKLMQIYTKICEAVASQFYQYVTFGLIKL